MEEIKTDEPVILVGMPRSGSTLTTALVNRSRRHYVLNDAYLTQIVDKAEAWEGKLRPETKVELVQFLSGLVSRRAGISGKKTVANSSFIESKSLQNLLDLYGEEEVSKVSRSWGEAIALLLGLAAAHAGKRIWGWNTPQDIYHLDRILASFPKAKFVCVMRDPHSMLRSFHNRPNTRARQRYHPAIQAIAWRKAARLAIKAKDRMPNQFFTLRYEDLINDTAGMISRLNEFLGSDIAPEIDLKLIGSNSSFRNQEQRPEEIAPIAQWIADVILYDARSQLGYRSPKLKFSIKGGISLIAQSVTFLFYYAVEGVRSGDIRKRIWRFLS